MGSESTRQGPNRRRRPLGTGGETSAGKRGAAWFSEDAALKNLCDAAMGIAPDCPNSGLLEIIEGDINTYRYATVLRTIACVSRVLCRFGVCYRELQSG